MSAGKLPSPSLERNPWLDQWLRIGRDGRVTVFTGKVELGQKNHAALAAIAAEELAVDIARIVMAPVDTRYSPDEQYTSGSGSMEESGVAIRHAAAQARGLLLTMAAEQLRAPFGQLLLADGEIRVAGAGSGENRWTSYWELMGDKRFECRIAAEVLLKPAADYRLVGSQGPALGFDELVTGKTCFAQDLDLPGMVHGRVVRPPGYHAHLETVDTDKVAAMPGVLRVLRSGRFLAVIAEREYQAVKAAGRLARLARWRQYAALDDDDIYAQLRRKPRRSLPVLDGVPAAAAVADLQIPEGAARTLRASYRRPYHMHASIGPSAAAAHWQEEKLTVWTHSQGIYPLRNGIAKVLGLDEHSIRVIHMPGPGCYGHNGADDAALDAALLARETPDRPLLLKWSREDEHRWEPYSSAMVVDTQASLDEKGRVLAWSHETFSDTHVARSRAGSDDASRLLAAWHLKTPWPAPRPQPNLKPHGGIHRNADPLYAFANKRIVKHLVSDLPLRVSATRSLGAYANVFALESFVDEIAYASGTDPLQFRLDNLRDPRARAVLEKAADAANWGGAGAPAPARETSVLSRQAVISTGRGLAFAQYKNAKTYAAVVIDIELDDFGNIRLQRAFIAADAGQIVDPDGVRSQLEGGLLQAASWTLKEEVRFDQSGVTSCDWLSYPILGFDEIPEIETHLLNRPGLPYLGAGEATQGPTPAAIANAVFSACGIRLRTIPFTAGRLREAAAQQESP